MEATEIRDSGDVKGRLIGDWETSEIMISATLDYILVECEKRGYDVVTISMRGNDTRVVTERVW